MLTPVVNVSLVNFMGRKARNPLFAPESLSHENSYFFLPFGLPFLIVSAIISSFVLAMLSSLCVNVGVEQYIVCNPIY